MKFTARVIDGWLPLPPEALAELDWKEVCGDTALAHKVEDRDEPKPRKKR